MVRLVSVIVKELDILALTVNCQKDVKLMLMGKLVSMEKQLVSQDNVIVLVICSLAVIPARLIA